MCSSSSSIFFQLHQASCRRLILESMLCNSMLHLGHRRTFYILFFLYLNCARSGISGNIYWQKGNGVHNLLANALLLLWPFGNVALQSIDTHTQHSAHTDVSHVFFLHFCFFLFLSAFAFCADAEIPISRQQFSLTCFFFAGCTTNIGMGHILLHLDKI